MTKVIVLKALDLLVVLMFHQLMMWPVSISPCRKSRFFSKYVQGQPVLQLVFQSLGLSSLFGVDHKRQTHAGKILVAYLTSLGKNFVGHGSNLQAVWECFVPPHVAPAVELEAFQSSLRTV